MLLLNMKSSFAVPAHAISEDNFILLSFQELS